MKMKRLLEKSNPMNKNSAFSEEHVYIKILSYFFGEVITILLAQS